MAAAVPIVEVADDRNALCVRGPQRKSDALDAVELARMCPELFVEPEMGALGEQVCVDLAQDETEAVRIVDLGRPVAQRDAQAIAHVRASTGHEALEESVGVNPPELDEGG